MLDMSVADFSLRVCWDTLLLGDTNSRRRAGKEREGGRQVGIRRQIGIGGISEKVGRLVARQVGR